MRVQIAIAISCAGAVLLIGAGISAYSAGPHPETICTQGVDRVILCVARHSTSAADMSRAKRDESITACMNEDRSVALYTECLGFEDCDEFMKCATQKRD